MALEAFSLLFQPLYFLMVWMFWEEWKGEEGALARALDMGIMALGVVFMGMQAWMLSLVNHRARFPSLKRLFRLSLGVWFLLEIVLSYWWCFVTGADPITQHTPFVILLALFLGGQHWALGKLEPTASRTP